MTGQYIKQNASSISMPNDQFADLMSAVLQNGTPFRFQASGFSMAPFIKDGDVITLANPFERRVHLGNVVAFINPSCNKLTIHRLVSIKRSQYLMKADNSRQSDGWIEKQHILGCVIKVERSRRSVKLGLGFERQLIGILSRYNLLMPVIRVFLPLLRPFLKGI